MALYFLKEKKLLIKITLNKDEVAYIPEGSLESIMKQKDGNVAIITRKTRIEGKASEFFNVECLEENI